jgi:hypothetical protein
MYLFDSSILTTTSQDAGTTSLTITSLNLNVYCEANYDLINIARQ